MNGRYSRANRKSRAREVHRAEVHRAEVNRTKDGDNQKAIDEAIAKAKAEWEKELEQKLKDAENEGMRKAKLTNEQRKKRTTTRNEKNLKKQRQSLNVKNRCICRNGTCQSRTVRRDCKVHCSRGQG